MGFYRFPECALFLRLYDATEQFEDRLKTNKLLHVPFCTALKSGERIGESDDYGLNEVGKLYNSAIPDWMFTELFKREMLGSNWINRDQLEQIYRTLQADVPEKVGLIIHSQIYSTKFSTGYSFTQNTLREALAELYPEESSIRRIIADSGISPSHITLNSSAINNWYSVLNEAEKIGRMDTLLNVVEREYVDNAKFRYACDTYRKSAH